MKRDWWFKFTLFLVIFTVCVLTVIPSVFNLSDKSTYPMKGKINLGLDLQGGLYMILGVDFQKIYKEEISLSVDKVIYSLKDQEIVARKGEFNFKDPMDPRFSINIDDLSKIDETRAYIKENFMYSIRLTLIDDNKLEFGLNRVFRTNIEKQAVKKSIEVIRNRIDEFGVTEPEILSQGDDRIIVQLPGVSDIERAKKLIGKTARLEFRIVKDDFSLATLNSLISKAEKKGIVYKPGERFSDYLNSLNKEIKKDLPKGFEVAFEKKINKRTAEIVEKIPYLVEDMPAVTGEDLQDAQVNIDQEENIPIVDLQFRPVGTKRFADLTENNVGKRLAIILDSNVYTAPSLRERIPNGRARITLGRGNYDELMQQARDIALVLRAGALPVELDFLEQRIIGPSLGEDSIKSAKLASIIGGIVVFLFILYFYKLSGVLVVFTLMLNILFVFAFLVGLEATLTLPGIAGIALTIGMAVDANIIIYERIKDELRSGQSVLNSIKWGFERAFWTIIDANLTTALAGFCLINWGTGPIKGFAVTLLIGIMATIYTSYFVSKMIYEFYLNKTQASHISI
jgi:preprotein translocase subunit SecD